jgi:hypothetical protein
MRIGNLVAALAVVAWSGTVLLLDLLGHDSFGGDGAYGRGQVVGFALMAVLLAVGIRGILTELRRRGRR